MNYVHQTGIFNPERARPVTLIGAGAVGSYTALALLKMGVTDLTVFDHDSVASHNIPMSLYREADMGTYKVDALAGLLSYLTGVQIKAVQKGYTNQPLSGTSVVICVDTMETRKRIWKQVLKAGLKVDILVDTRVERTYIEVLTVVPFAADERKNYEALLYTDMSAARQTCGNHGVVFTSLAAAQSVAANLASHWMCGSKKWRHGSRCDTLETVF